MAIHKILAEHTNADGLQIGGADEKVGFFGATPVEQQAVAAPVTITYTTGNPSITANGAVTVANGATPTVAELLELCVELNTKIGALQTQLQNLGLQATA